MIVGAKVEGIRVGRGGGGGKGGEMWQGKKADYTKLLCDRFRR